MDDIHLRLSALFKIPKKLSKAKTFVTRSLYNLSFTKGLKVYIKQAKKIQKSHGRKFKIPWNGYRDEEVGEWYCCNKLLETIKATRYYPHENRTLLTLSQSLAKRSLANALGNSYGEPRPGERYIMLRVTRNLGSGRTVRNHFLVDDDQVPQGEGEVMMLGRTTWCRIAEDLGNLVGSCGGFGNGVFKIACDRCGCLYHIRYHVSPLPCMSEVGNGMADSRRGSWI